MKTLALFSLFSSVSTVSSFLRPFFCLCCLLFSPPPLLFLLSPLFSHSTSVSTVSYFLLFFCLCLLFCLLLQLYSLPSLRHFAEFRLSHSAALNSSQFCPCLPSVLTLSPRHCIILFVRSFLSLTPLISSQCLVLTQSIRLLLS